MDLVIDPRWGDRREKWHSRYRGKAAVGVAAKVQITMGFEARSTLECAEMFVMQHRLVNQRPVFTALGFSAITAIQVRIGPMMVKS